MRLLMDIHNKAEQLQGKRLVYVLSVVFITSLLLGFVINYATQTLLKSNETRSATEDKSLVINAGLREFSGKITFIEPSFFPGENISYFLADNQGKRVILLKSTDQKLQVAEGLDVKVVGKIAQTKDGKSELLEVEKVIIMKGTQ